MQRICLSLHQAGFQVILVGRATSKSPNLTPAPFLQKRLHCVFNKGFLFYAEYNLKLFWWLLFQKTDAICAIDLDTIIPGVLITKLKRNTLVYDAHELFTEMIEVKSRPKIQKVWLVIEKWAVPKVNKAYTVNAFIAQQLQTQYKKPFSIIRNLPFLQPMVATPTNQQSYILYQGAVNHGRAFEQLIPAMQEVNRQLVICGDGNFMHLLKQLILKYAVSNKVELKGSILPQQLQQITVNAAVGVTLFEANGLNQYQSLSNRFFDYMMAGIPQVCVNYPEYAAINNQYQVALLIPDLEPNTIATALNKILDDGVLYHELHQNCLKARQELNWNKESEKLIAFWKNI
jgi:glycosyltransferase involved in cell wall biosynthesis